MEDGLEDGFNGQVGVGMEDGFVGRREFRPEEQTSETSGAGLGRRVGTGGSELALEAVSGASAISRKGDKASGNASKCGVNAANCTNSQATRFSRTKNLSDQV